MRLPSWTISSFARRNGLRGKVGRLHGTLLTLSLLVFSSGMPAAAAYRENFESPETSWRFAAADAAYRIHQHQRVQTQSHWGHGCEQLRVATGRGTFVYFRQEIGRPRVIDELVPSLWVKADRPGIQLLARVVFPRAVDDRTGRPVTALIRGGTYTAVGSWQRLAVENTPKLAAEQARVLTVQLGRDVDHREAYLDLVLLNAYCGTGIVELFVDDLEINGYLPVKDRPAPHSSPGGQQVAPADRAAGGKQAAGQVAMRGAVLSAGGRPFFPRVIEHRGESFEFLKRLGFNAVRVAAPPTPWQVAEARRHDMWIVGPPPDVRAGRGIGPSLDRVLAWDLGRNLEQRQLADVRDLALAVRRADEQTDRPLLAEADEQLRSYSRVASVMLLRRAPLETNFDLIDYATWFRARRQLLRPGTPAWATIQTQPSVVRNEQAQAAGLSLPANVDAQQIRLLALSAVSAGARGLLFTSRDRLDGEDQASLARAQALEMINRQLELIEPWLAVSDHVSMLNIGEQDVSAAMFAANHAQLILLTQIAPHAQHVVAPPARERLSLVVPGVPESSDAYLVSADGLRPLPHRRVTGGVGVAVDRLRSASAIVFTSDPLVYARLAQTSLRNQQRLAQLQLSATADLLKQTEPVLAALAAGRRGASDSSTSLAIIKANLSQGERMLATGQDQAASTYAHRAAVSLAQLRRDAWEQVAKPGDGCCSPLWMNFAVLPGRDAEFEKLASHAGANQAPSGNMEDLQRMVAAGWRHFRRDEPGIATHVELSAAGPNTGQFSLRLEATAGGEDAAACVESPPIWIRSPGVPLRAGQPYVIRGWVRIDAPLAGTVDGVAIHDSVQGPDFGLRIDKTDGWRPFTLHGVAMRNQPLALNIELTGLGEAFIDDVEIIVPGLADPQPARQPPAQQSDTTATRLRDLIRLPR